MRGYNSMNLWVYQIWSRHATCHQRCYQIVIKQGNQNPQNNMIASFSFASTGKLNSIVTSTGRDFDSTIKFITITGKEWFARGTEVASDIKQVGFTRCSLSPSPLKTGKLQSAVNSEWKHFCLTPHCCWIQWEKKKDLHAVSWNLHSRMGKNCSHNRAAKHRKISSSSRVIAEPFMTLMNTSTSN